MANLTGGVYITFNKPYLNKVSSTIQNDYIVIGNKKQKILSKSAKAFKKIVDSADNKKVLKYLKDGRSFKPVFETKDGSYKWSDIDKSQFTFKVASAADTKKQEHCSLLAIKFGIENNGYASKNIFMKKHRDELLEIYPDMTEEWENSFYAQMKRVTKELGNTKFTHYSRDDGFMDFITKQVKKYNISQKDTWNPADIWLVSDLSKQKRDITNLIKDDTTSIQRFNDVLRNKFKNKSIIGISLKKLSNKEANWELVNIESDLFEDNLYRFKELRENWSFNKKFKTLDTYLIAKTNDGEIHIQIKSNSGGSSASNLKFEAVDKSANKARLGKVPLDMLKLAMKDYGLVLENNHNNFPKTKDEFLNSSCYKRIPKKIKECFERAFDVMPIIASSKLMQYIFVDSFNKLNAKDKHNLVTDMCYLAQKKGDLFGPFAKLY